MPRPEREKKNFLLGGGSREGEGGRKVKALLA